MSLLALGLNHRSAPVSLREKVAIAAEQLPSALATIRTLPQVREAAIVSTCNRTEIFTVGGDDRAVTRWLSQHGQLEEAQLQPHLFSYDQPRAIRHALRVAAGLDSMILGEPQILGQMKTAFITAQEEKAIGPVLTRLFQHAFRVAKQVRSQTAIGARTVSVASAAATLTGEIFERLDGKDVLVIGAGDTARLVTEHLCKRGQPRLTVANRNPERARALAERFNGASCQLEAIPQQLERADLVVATVAAEQRLIDLNMVRAAFARRKRKAVLMIDLGVPRNIDPEVTRNEDIYLYTVDDLQAVTETNRQARESAADAAQSIIETGTQDFLRWLRNRRNATAISRLRQSTEAISQQHLRRAEQALARGEPPQAVLERFAHQLTRQFLHAPSVALRDLSEEDRAATLERLSILFQLDEDA